MKQVQLSDRQSSLICTVIVHIKKRIFVAYLRRHPHPPAIPKRVQTY
jgi:hypothetical protein